MGSAKDSEACGQVLSDQVLSVGALALNIATAGATSSANAAVEAGKDATKIK